MVVVEEEEVLVVVFFSFFIFLAFFTGLVSVVVVVVVVLLVVVPWAVSAGAAGAGVDLVEVFLVVFFIFLTLVVFFPGLEVSLEVEEAMLLVVVLLWVAAAAGLEDVWAKAGVMRAAATSRNNSFLMGNLRCGPEHPGRLNK